MRLVNLHIVKNRNGERATIQFDFDPQVSRFNEVGKTDYREPEE
jgi:replicative DNA helicase